MRSVVAAFLAPFLIATSLTQVLAQSAPQGPSEVQSEDFRVPIPVPTRTLQSSERPLSFSWVPSVEPNSPAALIWAAGAINSTTASEPLVYAAPAGLSNNVKQLIIIGAIILIVGAIIAISAATTG